MAANRRSLGRSAPLIDRHPAVCMLSAQLTIGFGMIAIAAWVSGSHYAANALAGGCIIFVANVLAVYYAFYSKWSVQARFNALLRAQWVKFIVVFGGFAAVLKWLHPLRAEILLLGFGWVYMTGWVAFAVALRDR